MSLYDKASLIFSGAAGAGNDEVAYNIKPEEKLKVDEYVTNGDFINAGDGWEKTGSDITFSDGKAVFSGLDGYNYLRTSTPVFEKGKTYKVSFTVTDFTSVGNNNPQLIIQESSNQQPHIGSIKTSGKYVFIYEAKGHESNGVQIGTPSKLVFKNSGPGGSGNETSFKLDNVSVREVEQKANDFSFVRASDLTATHEGADGLIKKTRQNLLLQSNQFDTTWTLNSASLTGGKGGYDGSSNAWELKATGNGSTHLARLNQTSLSVSGVSTFSVYAKAGNVNWIRLNALTSGTNVNNYFDLSGNGAVGASPSNTVVESKIESIGSNWFRISLTSKGEASITEVRIQVAEADGDEIPATNSYIFIQNSQLEPGLVATPYIDRTDSNSKSTDGIQEDEPRYDYSLDNALPPALLYEPERKNEVPNSEGVVEATNSVTLTVNHGTAPDGTKSSLKVAKNGSNGHNERILPITTDNVTLTNSVNYSISAFVKNIDCTGVTTLACRTDAGSNELFRQGFQWTGASLALTSTGASGTRTKAFVESYGNNWWRIGFTFTANSTAGNFELDIDRVNGSATTSIETWGWQLEKGSCVTSYIPTYGSAATRKGDTIPQYTPSKTNLDKYTFFAHSHSDRVVSDNRAPRFKGDGNSTLMGCFVNNDGKKQFFFDDNESNRPLSKATFGSFEAGDDTKYAFVVDNIALEAKLFIDGALRETMSLTERADAKILSVGNSDGNPDRIKSIMYFPEALEDADVVSLTT
jgi:hypothetical protein|tara:strand:+ start:110 stop:2362 length:2253 start_codon:yes stop_codon:yes gene_type:complete